MISTHSLPANGRSDEEHVTRPISEAEATANNHDRIMRMAKRQSRAPRPAELAALRAAVKRTFDYMPDVDTRDNLFCSMFPETLSLSNLADLDARGYVMDKIEGVAANAWALYVSVYPPKFAADTKREKVVALFPDEPAPYVGDDCGDATLAGRTDTLMLVFRDGGILCYDRCPLLPMLMKHTFGRTGFDGELCVRRRTLMQSERARMRAVLREDAEFGAPYLEPDDDRPTSDDAYDLCYLVHDIMCADTDKQTASTSRRKQPAAATLPYSQRLAKIKERVEIRPLPERVTKATASAPSTSSAPKPLSDYDVFVLRMQRCSYAQPPLLVAAKQPFPMSLARYAFHTRMARIVGIRTDGLIFVGESQQFSPVFINADGSVINPSQHEGPTCLKKLKPRLSNSFDAMLVRNATTQAYELYASDRDTPVPSAGLWYGTNEEEIERTRALGHEVVEANTAAQDARLFRADERAASAGGRSVWHSVVCECNPYLSKQAETAIAAVPPPANAADEQRYVDAVGKHIRWQPVLERTKKKRPNTYANFCGIIKAIGMFVDRDELCAHVKTITTSVPVAPLDADTDAARRRCVGWRR